MMDCLSISYLTCWVLVSYVYSERGSNLLDPGTHLRHSSKGLSECDSGTPFLEGKYQLWGSHYTLGVSHSGLAFKD